MSWHLHKSDNAGVIDGITIENARERVAEWRRYYSGRLDNRCKIEIEAYTFLRSRHFNGTLTQPNGNAISFDPARIADKIIDPLLVPLVTVFCEKMFAADRAYIKGPLDHFLDEKGVRWSRG